MLKSNGISRREMLLTAAALTCAAGANSGFSLPAAAADGASEFSEWGWPKKYEQVSAKSIDWLKSKGWWPLQVGWNPQWSDGNVTLFAMKQYNLLAQRGIEAEFKPFQLAPLFNEVYIPGKIQVAQGSSLGVLRLIDLVKKQVREKTGVELESEVRCIPYSLEGGS